MANCEFDGGVKGESGWSRAKSLEDFEFRIGDCEFDGGGEGRAES